MFSEMEKNKKKLIQTLIRGRDSAKRLQNLLRLKIDTDGSVSAEDLVMEILGSFSSGLSVLNSCGSGEFSGVPASSHVDLDCSFDKVPEVYAGNTGKKPAPAVKERRGCYKRRRTVDSRVKISESTEDGYAWRKYGQKEILNSKFPRCYFRCTHKPVHGCKALKQVQKLEDGSNMFHITYFGNHTCPTPNTCSHTGSILDFSNSKNHHYFSNSPSNVIQVEPFIKQEVDSKAQSTDVSDIVSSGNNDDHSSPALEWKEILIDDLGPCHEGAFMGFDHEDSCASTSSHAYLDMEFLKDVGFSSDLLLDEVFPRLI